MSLTNPRSHSPFRLDGAVNTPLPRPVNKLIETALEKFSGLSRLDSLYRTLPDSASARDFLQIVLDLFGIRYRIETPTDGPLPDTGPVVIVANHPFGGLEGVILAHYLLHYRPDVKFMANYFLERIPELANLFIGVDPFGGPAARRTNLRPLRAAREWLNSGGVLVVFPAGEVSHLHARQRRVTDPEWSASVARLARTAGATVVPMYFHGANSLAFQLLGLVNPRLRTALLPRELLNKERRDILVTSGAPIRPKQLAGFEDDRALIRYLRLRTYSLAGAGASRATRAPEPPLEGNLIAPVPAEVVGAEIDALPADQKLVENGAFSVWYAGATQIPNGLREIGRLREVSFRLAGEGTGNPLDLDIFDSYYLHLILWDGAQRRIAGAYRLGLVDEILKKYGKKGLYTQRLFRYRTPVLRALPAAIELGRSFIAPDYQKSYSPLLLLWKGIGAFLVRRPGYRVLFGPVSISSDYSSLSQQLLVDFLRVNRFDLDLARHVRPRNAFRESARRVWHRNDIASLTDVDRLSDVIAQLEADGKGVPVLLRQYLKLGGRLLGFNVDPDFNNALDGLIMVDLLHTDPSVLQKYMGREAAENYLVFHRAQAPAWRAAS